VPFATNEGVRISYEVTGRGPPLVLHHGFSQSSKDWYRAGYVDELTTTHTVILIDARGHGDSDKPHDESAYIWPVQVFDIVAVLDELKVSKAAYWGYSMGAEFGFGIAVYAPHRMSALILGGASAHGSDMGVAFRGIDGTDPDAFLERLARRTGGSSIDADARTRLFENDLCALSAAAQDRPSLEHMLGTIEEPCFLYAGGADKDLARARESATQIPHARFTAFANLEHGEAFDRSEIVLPEAVRFLEHIRQ
jgi:pimeloyl-ACP methyl ester carboxylesterase